MEHWGGGGGGRGRGGGLTSTNNCSAAPLQERGGIQSRSIMDTLRPDKALQALYSVVWEEGSMLWYLLPL